VEYRTITYTNNAISRSGKIVRRALRKISAGEEDQLGDTSTIADPSVIDVIVKAVKAADAKK
jgi:acetyl-CoA synthetase